MFLSWAYLLLFGVLSSVNARDNGLALTPPMGWLSWLRYGCSKSCYSDYTECISTAKAIDTPLCPEGIEPNAAARSCCPEALIKRTADLMVSEGYLAAGYQYIIIDDCWQEHGSYMPDPDRFPSGMKTLADYVHSKGLKLGLLKYINQTELTIDTLASWGIDYVKIIHYNSKQTVQEDYTALSHQLNKTGRQMFYSCSWPYWEEELGIHPDYSEVAKHCNSWRSYYNIEDSWASVLQKMNWFGNNQARIAPFTGPGRWSDPDELAVGNYGLTVDQAQVQMAIWSIWAAPLIMSIDPGNIREQFKTILLNRDVIAVNQDKLGQQGLRVWKNQELEVWTRKLSEGCYAVALVNLGYDSVTYTFTHEDMKLPQLKYIVKDLYDNKKKETLFRANEKFSVVIPATGVKFYKFIPYQ